MSGEPKKHYFELNSVDVTSYVINSDTTRESDNRISEAYLMLKSNIKNIMTVDDTLIGNTIIIKRGPTLGTETTIFRGSVIRVLPNGSFIELRCYDRLQESVDKQVTISFDSDVDDEAGVVSEIFKTLMVDYAGLNADNTTIQNTGTDIVLGQYICNHASVFERGEKLAQIFDWQFYYKPSNDMVYLEPRGSIDNGRILSVGSEIIKVPKWDYDGSQIINKITVLGAVQEVETTELFDGNGSQTTFVLLHKPVSAKVYVGGVLKTGGKPGQTNPYDYEVGYEAKQIIFDSSSIPASGTENIEVAYSYYLDTPVVMDDSESITKYKLKETSIRRQDLTKVSDAELFANNYLSAYSEPPLSSPLRVVDANEYSPGEIVTINDNVNNINKTGIIQKIRMFYPYVGDEITIGQRQFKPQDFEKSVLDRIKRLEEESGGSEETLLHVFNSLNEQPLIPRYAILSSRDTSIDGVWGIGFGDGSTTTKYTWGQAGALWQSDWTNDLVNQQIILKDNIFVDDLRDEDFNDTSNTTATWNTSTQTLSFTSGQIVRTLPFALNTEHSFATLLVGSVTGTLKYEITQDDDDTRTELTPNNKTALEPIDLASNKSTYLIITENATSTASLTNTLDSYNRINKPAIQVILE